MMFKDVLHIEIETGSHNNEGMESGKSPSTKEIQSKILLLLLIVFMEKW